ncbi:MAG TPA: PIG-L family deacetylase [Burkholderiales bacterium]|nr:PIG-L family deacetylase [Burkholderiales bacterium]
MLAIGAHPDDIELGIGGTLALLARNGARVVMAICSVPADYDTRLAEAKAAAQILGAELRILMDGGCKRIEDVKNYQLVGIIDDLVRELSPAGVLTHGPTDFHRDHVTVYNASTAAQRLSSFDFYSYLPTMCRPVPVPFQPRAYIDISTTIEVKLQSIAAHQSQFWSRGLAFDMYRDISRINGRMAGVEYAEGVDVNRIVFS